MAVVQLEHGCLLPCPFCGGEVAVESDSGMFAGLFWLVGCETAGCYANRRSGSMFYSENDAIAAWNKRADAHEGCLEDAR